jgi:hypothetical protein
VGGVGGGNNHNNINVVNANHNLAVVTDLGNTKTSDKNKVMI